MLKDLYYKGVTEDAIKKIPHARLTTYVIKNYPEGEMSIIDNVWSTHYVYKESMELQDWSCGSDSVKTILGHQCQMATCEFRGRHWTAWFALDIPICDGPWKFRGLPGLILEVYDSNYQHHFCINGMQNVVAAPIYYGVYGKDVKYEKTDQKSFLKAKYDWLRNGNDIAEAITGITVSKSKFVPRRDLLEREDR